MDSEMTPTPRNDSWYEPTEYETCPQCDDDSIHRDVCLNGDCGFAGQTPQANCTTQYPDKDEGFAACGTEE